MLDWIVWLPPNECELMRMRHEHEMTPTQIATAINAHHESVATTLRRIEKRVKSPLFQFAATNHDRLPTGTRLFARWRYLHGLPLCGVAEKLDCGVSKARELDASFRGAIQILCATGNVGEAFVLRPNGPERMKFQRRTEAQFKRTKASR